MIATPSVPRDGTWQRTSVLLELCTSPLSITSCTNGPAVTVARIGWVEESPPFQVARPELLRERRVKPATSRNNTSEPQVMIHCRRVNFAKSGSLGSLESFGSLGSWIFIEQKERRQTRGRTGNWPRALPQGRDGAR